VAVLATPGAILTCPREHESLTDRRSFRLNQTGERSARARAKVGPLYLKPAATLGSVVPTTGRTSWTWKATVELGMSLPSEAQRPWGPGRRRRPSTRSRVSTGASVS
jgi:hypothetical protein